MVWLRAKQQVSAKTGVGVDAGIGGVRMQAHVWG